MAHINILSCPLVLRMPQLHSKMPWKQSLEICSTGKKDLPRHVTHREADCGPVIYSIFDAWQYDVLWTCTWMWTVLYQLYMMTRNCTRFDETQESQRPDAWSQFFLTWNVMEHGRTEGMMPVVNWFLHIELWIVGEPGLMPLVKHLSTYQAIDHGRARTDATGQELSTYRVIDHG